MDHFFNPYHLSVQENAKFKYCITILLISCLIINNLNAQTNTFPSSGNVGIGTTTPNATLDVNGTISMSQFPGLRIAPTGSSENLGIGTWSFSGIHFYSTCCGYTDQNNGSIVLYPRYGQLKTRGDAWFATDGGNVGIGTTGPNEKLSVAGNLFLTGLRSEIYGTDRNHMIVLRGRQDGTIIDETNYYQFGDHVFSTGGYVNSQVERLRITSTGNVGIGTSAPSEKLSVNGNIRSKKLIVTQNGWSDYVFNDGYNLRPLAQVESFIKENKHLPEVPTEKEVEKNGVDVGETQALLLKKIEELTLYVIELKKENIEMKEEIIKLKERNK